MGNTFEMDGRGPSNRQLLLAGVGVLVVLAMVTAVLLAKSTGRLEPYVRVVADLVNVGDGLPQKSDVKYHGLLVGSVDNVVPAAHGNPNFVHINLQPQYAKSIPASVTARVVPSNIFAVSSVQLVDPGKGSATSPIQEGTHIAEDEQLPTVVFQTTISKLRDILAATGRGREDNTVGLLAAVQAATQNRRQKLLTSGAQLNRALDELDKIVATDPSGPTTLSTLIDATQGLQETAPELIETLHQAVRPMQTLVEQRGQLQSLLSAGLHTVGTTHTSFANHSDQLVTITGQLTPVMGVLAKTSPNFVPAFVKLNELSKKFFDEVWLPETDTANFRINVSLTPSYTYSRADCPQYGELKAPSCFTAPLIPVRPDLPETLMPQNYQPPKDLAPPRGAVVGPDGNLIAVGPPLINPQGPNLVDPNPPLPPGFTPAPPVPDSANPAFAPGPFPEPTHSPVAPVAPKPGDTPPPAPAPAPAPAPGFPAEAAPAGYVGGNVGSAASGGNVGPVGSPAERAAISIITGQPASPATQLLIGPVVRGMTVDLAGRQS
ncbi:MAG TPA: MCE family protein [Mycobacterium sp.]|nr:MCE family protein [Mycobacterium sp.]